MIAIALVWCWIEEPITFVVGFVLLLPLLLVAS